MKHFITTIAAAFVFTSCGNNQSSAVSTADSSTVNTSVSTPDTSSIGTGAVTGTTGTGTVSDSGNAAHAGSGVKIDSVNTSTRTTSLNGTDTIKR